jgi:cellulose biosynthesis protein BcsQ
MRIISFMSQKGGVGKSTACVNLAAVLAERRYKILILDLDANACASQIFGAVGCPENSIAGALLGEHPLPSLIRAAGIEGIWLVPGTTLLSALDEMQVAQPERLTESGRLSDECGITVVVARTAQPAVRHWHAHLPGQLSTPSGHKPLPTSSVPCPV